MVSGRRELKAWYGFQQNYEKKVKEAAAFLEQFLPDHFSPQFGITLGSGLGDLADEIMADVVIPYKDIPHFPQTTVPGHEGTLIFGELKGVQLAGLKGRKHYYEVADLPFNVGMLQVVFPVHVLAELGFKNYFATNAAGGLNQEYNIGDMMVISSHINMMPNALLGRQHDFSRVDDGQPVWRFQPMNGAYDQEWSNLLLSAAGIHGRHMHHGKYLAVTGPTYETEGECLAFREGMGADAVGMSTAPEVIVARNRGMKCVGMSCITNKIAADGTNATNHEEVKAILESSEVRNRLTSTVADFFALYRERNNG
ncbi:MAG: purine-nucleoside phosphorylase [Nanoarchaeota archaeon]|nr:purine-nucleoside phosphorylase [Nanoarchaeota archaeon]